jgi:ribosomal protein L11 methyltransferase
MFFPAIHVTTDDRELIYALLDDHAPSAIEDRDDGLRVFFSTRAARDVALAAVSGRYLAVPIDVADEDWARRSQQNLSPVTVGRITVHPAAVSAGERSPRPADAGHVHVVIPPSMGFGTGHHATTRLCLAALQQLDLRGRTVVDAGTGSGVLAIAASRLGAVAVTGIDFDPDAIDAARQNLVLNPEAVNVSFVRADLADGGVPRADVVMANLTGRMLIRSAPTLIDAPPPGGILILSGILADERDAVVRAFAEADVFWERCEDGWVGLAVKKR